MDRMVAHGPSFCDITWGAGGSTADLTLEISNRMQNMVRLFLYARVPSSLARPRAWSDLIRFAAGWRTSFGSIRLRACAA
jgi:hypothetical protein